MDGNDLGIIIKCLSKFLIAYFLLFKTSLIQNSSESQYEEGDLKRFFSSRRFTINIKIAGIMFLLFGIIDIYFYFEKKI